MRISDWSSDVCSSDLESFRDAEVPDLVGPDLRLVFVGINPGLWTAATQTHFAHPANRFYPALYAAGILTEAINPGKGMSDEQRAAVLARGIGITNLVRRATARADELDREELRAGGQELAAFVAKHRPKVVAIAGITRSEEHTSELQSLMRISYAVFCLKKKNTIN